MMIYGGVKLLFKIHYSNKWLNMSAGLLWLIGLITVLFIAITTGKDFNENGKVKDPINLTAKRDTIHLTLSNTKELYEYLKVHEEDLEDYDDDGNHRSFRRGHRSDYIVAKSNDKRFIIGYAKLNILPAPGDQFELYVLKKARGEDKRSAVERAKAIQYSVSQNDSSISFNKIFTVEPNEKFRVQEVQVILKVPKGKVIFLDKSLANFIYDIENKTNTYDGDMVNRRWIMTNDGLECVDCDGIGDESPDEKNHKNIEKYHEIPPPPPPPGEINVDAKDAKVNIDQNGIHVDSKDAEVKINKNGIHIDTKGEKGDKGQKGPK